MIEHQHGKIIFICDDCGDDFETNTKSIHFFQALDKVKEEGWLITRDDDDEEWLHICNECATGRKG